MADDTDDLFPDDSPEALRDAMRARMGLDDPDPDELDEHDDEEPQDPGDSEAVPRMGADGGGGGEGAEPPVENGDPLPDDEDEPPATPPATPPAPPAADPIGEDYIRINGKLYPRSQEEQLGQLIDWSMQQILNAPVEPQVPVQPPVSQPQPPAPQEPAWDPQQFVDPDLAQAVDQRFEQSLSPLEQKVDLLLQQQQVAAQAAAAARQRELDEMAELALADVQQRFGLSDEERANLELATVQGGFGAVIAPRFPNPQEGFVAALEAAYWATPEFRSRAIQSAASEAAEQARVAAEQQAATQQREARKSRAGALAGNGSSLTRQVAPPSTKQERRAAMVDRFAQAMNEG